MTKVDEEAGFYVSGTVRISGKGKRQIEVRFHTNADDFARATVGRSALYEIAATRPRPRPGWKR